MSAQQEAITVKAYLERADSTPEIRRFSLDQDVSTSFEYLRGKISSIYPALTRQPFDVFWKDPEGDNVSISSDEELLQALLYGREENNLMRIYLKDQKSSTTKRPQSASQTDDKPVHEGVVCDGCEGPITGVRFKCMVCPDYDLCSDCCDKGTHKEHNMMRMTTPVKNNFQRKCGSRQGYFMPPFPGGLPMGMPPMPPPPAWGTGRPGSWGGNCRNQGMKRFWRQFMRNQAGFNDEPNDPHAEDVNPPGEASQSADGCPMQDGVAEEKDYLQHVGEQVSAWLEPLGINVDVEVGDKPNKAGGQQGKRQGKGCQNGKKANKCANNGKCKKPAKCNYGGACADASGECLYDGKCTPAEDCMKKCGETAPVKDPEQGAPKSDMNLMDGDDSWIKVENKQEDMDVIVLDEKPRTPSLDREVAGASAPPPEPTGAAAPPPVIDLEQEPMVTAGHGNSGLYPSLSEVQPRDPPPQSDLDRKVAEAIEQMRSMGFHDNGGWLTAMMYQYNGDCSKVIDIVLSRAQVPKE